MARRSCRCRRGFEPCQSPVGISLFLFYKFFSDVLIFCLKTVKLCSAKLSVRVNLRAEFKSDLNGLPLHNNFNYYPQISTK